MIFFSIFVSVCEGKARQVTEEDSRNVKTEENSAGDSVHSNCCQEEGRTRSECHRPGKTVQGRNITYVFLFYGIEGGPKGITPCPSCDYLHATYSSSELQK